MYIFVHMTQLVVNYRGGKKTYALTPNRNKIGKRLARRSYPAFTKAVVTNFSVQTVSAVCKKAHEEMKHLSLAVSDSVLSHGEVNLLLEFSWDVIWSEFQKYLPTVVSIFTGLTNDLPRNKPLICLLIAMILKRNHQRMSLVQRIMSIFLYGNGVHKQVHYIAIFISIS